MEKIEEIKEKDGGTAKVKIYTDKKEYDVIKNDTTYSDEQIAKFAIGGTDYAFCINFDI